MSITVTSAFFTDEYTGVYSGNGADTGIPFMKGCVGDLTWCTIQFYAQTAVTDTPMNFSTADNSITRRDCLGTGSFIADGFKAGDTIVITGTSDSNSATYTILSVTATQIITTTALSLTAQYSSVNIYLNNSLSNASVDFYYNIIPDNFPRNFNSLTDVNSQQKFSGVLPLPYASDYLNTATRSLAWWEGSTSPYGYYVTHNLLPFITSEGVTTDYKFQYTLIVPFLIKPFYRADQLQVFKDAFANSLLSGTAQIDTINSGFTVPSYFQGGSTLNFIYEIDVRQSKSDVAPRWSTGIQFIEGDVAWFNDLFPKTNTQAGIQKFYLNTATTYTTLAAVSVDSIDYKKPTQVLIKLQDTGFSNGDKVILNVMWLPTGTGSYQNTNAQSNPANFREVFMHDRCEMTVGTGLFSDGDKAGTGFQIITLSKADISGGVLDVIFTADLGASLVTTLDAVGSQNWNYLIWVTPQFQSITTLADANRNSVMVDVNTFFTNTDDTTALVINTDGTTDVHYFRYPDVNVNPVTNISDFVGSYPYAKCGFKTNGKINSVRVRFEVQVFDGSSNLVGTFNLEDWNKDTTGFWNGAFSDIDIEETRDFNLPDGDIRNTRSIVRDATLDGGGYYGYKIIYGFQLGYIFWIPTDVSPEFNNYAVQYWAAFTQGQVGGSSLIPSGYTTQIQQIFTWQIENVTTGIVTEFNHSCDIDIYDQFNGGAPDGTIATTDQYGNNLGGLILADAPTTITITYNGHGTTIGTPVAPYTSIVGIMGVYRDDGMNQVFDWTTSEGDSTPNTLWTTTPIITIVSPIQVTVSGTIDFSQSELPISTYRIIQTLSYKV